MKVTINIGTPSEEEINQHRGEMPKRIDHQICTISFERMKDEEDFDRAFEQLARAKEMFTGHLAEARNKGVEDFDSLPNWQKPNPR